MKNEKIVLCRPTSGLNDTLVQIEKCYRYCKKFKRKLIVDGSISGFLDDLANYFIPLDSDVSFGKIDFLDPPFDVFPKCLFNDLYNYELHFDETSIIPVLSTTNGVPLTFDFQKDYKEQILVHVGGGGGHTSIFTLTRLSLEEKIKTHIRNIIEDLKKLSGKKRKYDAIHVRNTDHKTDYKPFFNELKHKLDKTTVLCTDDYECQQYAKIFFGEKLKVLTDIPDLSSSEIKTLHLNNNIDRYKTNVDALADLFLLAYADKIFSIPCYGGYYGNYYGGKVYALPGRISGFYTLAKSLHDNKGIINYLLYRKNNLFTYQCSLIEFYFGWGIKRFLNLLSDKGLLFAIKYAFRRIKE
jgi:hypothetical protein